MPCSCRGPAHSNHRQHRDLRINAAARTWTQQQTAHTTHEHKAQGTKDTKGMGSLGHVTHSIQNKEKEHNRHTAHRTTKHRAQTATATESGNENAEMNTEKR